MRETEARVAAALWGSPSVGGRAESRQWWNFQQSRPSSFIAIAFRKADYLHAGGLS